MGIKEKIERALRRDLEPAKVLLNDDRGISGFVVSSRFQGITALDRQRMIDGALRHEEAKLSAAERRKILAIAAFTPREFDAVDPGVASRYR